MLAEHKKDVETPQGTFTGLANHCWCATDTGILKSVDLQKKTYENYFFTKEIPPLLNKQISITHLTWGRDNNSILVGLKNGLIRDFSVTQRTFIRQCQLLTNSEDKLTGLHSYNDTLMGSSESGELIVRPLKQDPLQVKSDSISQMRGLENSLIVATGGHENDLKVWDFASIPHQSAVSSLKPTFSAKNVRDDKLGSRVPVYITAIDFLKYTDGRVLVTGTKYGQVRLYDTRTQRRPVGNIFIGMDNNCISCICSSNSSTPNTTNVLVGDNIGNVLAIDSRVNRVVGKFRGSVGSVRNIQCSDRYVGVCGLDRFVRVYDVSNNRLVEKLYLKLELNALLLDTTLDAIEFTNNNVLEDDNTEDVWAQLPVKNEPTNNSKRIKIDLS